MEADFWQARWRENRIGFHESKPNPLLLKHLDRLGLAPGARLFLPLCGKTLDIGWLLANGYRVAGAELSRIAIDQLFAELGVVPQESPAGALTRCSAPGLDIYVGDIFALDADTLGPVDAVYDRAALVALPQEMRVRYAPHLAALTGHAPQLLLCFEYDQSLVPGPPFSVDEAHVRALYEPAFRVSRLDSVPLAGGLKGKFDATEHVFLLGRA